MWVSTGVTFDQQPRQCRDIPGLALPQPDSADMRGNPGFAQRHHRGGVGCGREQSLGRLVHRDIGRLGRKHHRDQQGEGIGEAQFRLRRGVGVRECLDEGRHLFARHQTGAPRRGGAAVARRAR